MIFVNHQGNLLMKHFEFRRKVRREIILDNINVSPESKMDSTHHCFNSRACKKQ